MTWLEKVTAAVILLMLISVAFVSLTTIRVPAPSHAQGANAEIVNPPPHVRRTLGRADLIWMPGKISSGECYLELRLPAVAFVTVPDEFCQGMR